MADFHGRNRVEGVAPVSAEPTLAQLLIGLQEAMAEYSRAANRMFEVHSARIDLADSMIVELRDDTHEALTALSNRIEGAVRSE